jgi:hypothetical protein
MDIEALRLEALRLAWAAEARPEGATYAQSTPEEVIERAQHYLAFLEGKVPDTVSARITDALSVSPAWIKAAQKYVRNHPPHRRAKHRKRHARK